MRLIFIRSFAYFMLLLLASCQKKLESPTAPPGQDVPPAINKKPNIILLVVDDVGYEVLTSNGGSSYKTTALDEIGQEGRRFVNCHSMPLCSPSRVELLTGKYGFRNYIQWGTLSTGNYTIANMLRDAGYATGIYGKWQNGGGDASIRALGFDEYLVHDALDAKNRKSRYKDPYLYYQGEFLPGMTGKYGDDVVQDSLFSFMSRHIATGEPFFAYYPMLLCHKPYQPTPDDPEFATWDVRNSDERFYPAMVKYMDKLVLQLYRKIYQLGIADNTVLLITSDNGSPGKVYSQFNGLTVRGGKGKPTVYGTHVPLIVSWKNRTPVGIDSSLIDFSDFLPTLAGVAKASYAAADTVDGVSFYHNIIGAPGLNREWSYRYMDAHPDDEDEDEDGNGIGKTIWVMNKTYKKYEYSTGGPFGKTGQLFNYAVDPLDSIRILPRTPLEKQYDLLFTHVIQNMHY